ncbi:MAG TPA: bifunctional DNA primase/polymerase [Pirellulales bacterium]|jgi:hypothetical protein|nr:bifunctional DNA primase/polymerase [Pirellulales bacterium]
MSQDQHLDAPSRRTIMDRRVLDEFGYKAFELPFGQKAPPPTGWQKLAGRMPLPDTSNYGISTENFGVVDLDDPPLIERFERKYRGLLTTVVETPNDGRHYYFSGETRNQQHDGWDVRGKGGYVVGAGSWFAGKMYRLLTELQPVDLLKPFPDELQPRKSEQVIVPKRRAIDVTDPLERIAMARRWLAKADSAGNDSRGSSKMFFACCRMFQVFNLTMDQAVGPILEYNARFRPPFGLKDIRHKLEDAQQAAIQ